MSSQQLDAFGILSRTIDDLRRTDAILANKIIARVLNHHMFIRASTPDFRGELGSEDVELIWDALALSISVTRLSKRGPEAYAPPSSIPTGRQQRELGPLPRAVRPVPDLTEIERNLRNHDLRVPLTAADHAG